MVLLWRRRRDLNPRDTFAPYSLSRGAPSPLGYFSKGCCLHKKNVAERVGFEPTRPFGQTVFKTASLWPLRYLSVSKTLLSSKKYYSIASVACQLFSGIFSFFVTKKFANKSLTFVKIRCIPLFNMLYYGREKKTFFVHLVMHSSLSPT